MIHPKRGMRNQWEGNEKCSRITAALDRRVAIQQELRSTVTTRSLLVGEARYTVFSTRQ